jgi:hypothetical protein
MAQAQTERRKDNGKTQKGAAASRSGTPERDELYGLISVLYHALQGSQTYQQYTRDAESGGDDELASFFEACREEENQRATQAKQLLADRIGGEGAEDEDEDEDKDEEDE